MTILLTWWCEDRRDQSVMCSELITDLSLIILPLHYTPATHNTPRHGGAIAADLDVSRLLLTTHTLTNGSTHDTERADDWVCECRDVDLVNECKKYTPGRLKYRAEWQLIMTCHTPQHDSTTQQQRGYSHRCHTDNTNTKIINTEKNNLSVKLT